MGKRLRAIGSCVLLSLSIFAAGCGGAEDDASVDDATETTDALTSANARTTFQFFVAKGLSDVQAAAIVGNLQQESGLNPSSVQPGGPGRGIAQWSTGARWNVSSHDNVAWYAAQHGGSAHSLDLQLEFIWYELTTFSQYGLASLRHASSIETAVHVFQSEFEACGACASSKRVQYAKSALASYGNR